MTNQNNFVQVKTVLLDAIMKNPNCLAKIIEDVVGLKLYTEFNAAAQHLVDEKPDALIYAVWDAYHSELDLGAEFFYIDTDGDIVSYATEELWRGFINREYLINKAMRMDLMTLCEYCNYCE